VASLESVAQARRAAGCLDFVVAADPLEPDRVNVYGRWDSEAHSRRSEEMDPAPTDIGDPACERPETPRLVIGRAIARGIASWDIRRSESRKAAAKRRRRFKSSDRSGRKQKCLGDCCLRAYATARYAEQAPKVATQNGTQ
jgi:hypothetical protein